MSTGAMITLGIAWSYILIMVVYFFVKVLKKEHEQKKLRGDQSNE